MLDIAKRMLFYRKNRSPELPSEPFDVVLDPEDARTVVIATVSEFKDVPAELVTNNTLLGDVGNQICLVLCIQFGRTIFADSNTTVGELIAQLEEV
jgi:hypothetical protein